MDTTDDKLVPLIDTDNEFHERQITDALNDAGIEFVVQNFFDQGYDGLFQKQQGFSRILIFDRDAKQAAEVLQSLPSPNRQNPPS